MLRRVRRRDEIAHPSPDVDLVGGLGADKIVSEVGWLVGRAKRPIGGLLIGQKMRDGVDLGVSGAQRRVRAGDRCVIGGDSGGEIGIGRVHLRLKVVERSIVEGEPPFPAGRKLGTARCLILEFRRQRHRRRSVAGRKVAAAERERDRRRKPRPPLHSP
jgi:hypothetical protein